MRKLMGIPFVSLFIVFFIAQLIFGGPGLAISFAVLAGIGFQKQKAWHVFLVCALAMGLGWFLYAYYLDNLNDSILSERILGLFPLKNRFILVLASSIVGGIWAGTAGLAGLAVARMFNKK